MKWNLPIIISILISVELSSESELKVTVNHEEMTIIKGKEANLVCSIESEALGQCGDSCGSCNIIFTVEVLNLALVNFLKSTKMFTIAKCSLSIM